jgi:hypothetical protein
MMLAGLNLGTPRRYPELDQADELRHADASADARRAGRLDSDEDSIEYPRHGARPAKDGHFPTDGRFAPILLQKSQNVRRLISRHRTKQRTTADQQGFKRLIRIACEFAVR